MLASSTPRPASGPEAAAPSSLGSGAPPVRQRRGLSGFWAPQTSKGNAMYLGPAPKSPRSGRRRPFPLPFPAGNPGSTLSWRAPSCARAAWGAGSPCPTGHEAGGIRGGTGTPGPTPTYRRRCTRCTQRPRVLTPTPHRRRGAPANMAVGAQRQAGPGGARAGAGQGLAHAGRDGRDGARVPAPEAPGPAPPRPAQPGLPGVDGSPPAASFQAADL